MASGNHTLACKSLGIQAILAWRNSLKLHFTFEINWELFAYVTWKTIQYQFLGVFKWKAFHNLKANCPINANYLSCSCTWPVQLAFCPMKFWINWTMDQYAKKLVSSPESRNFKISHRVCRINESISYNFQLAFWKGERAGAKQGMPAHFLLTLPSLTHSLKRILKCIHKFVCPLPPLSEHKNQFLLFALTLPPLSNDWSLTLNTISFTRSEW